MSFIGFVKNRLTGLPYPVGKVASLVPYRFRPSIGQPYGARRREIATFEEMDAERRKAWVFEAVKRILDFAATEVPFYGEHYAKHEFRPESVRSFDDIERIPVVTKSDFLQASLENRSSRLGGTHLVNTGGSSGKTLDLLIMDSSVGHEWAHMHHVWRRVGYDHSQLRLVFGGRSNLTGALDYDSARHQYNVNIYAGWDVIAAALSDVYGRHPPKYLHGYPSALFDFVRWLESNDTGLLAMVRRHTEGMLLGSEFPAPQLRSRIEKLLDCRSISWYGHTERAVLAYEKHERYRYVPMMTYGLCEAVCDGASHHLVGTSYHNRATPLVRYDTEDRIAPAYRGGMLSEFTISDGRNGEYVVDRRGVKIYLTALIFGRHHEIFNKASQIQIGQPAEGRAEIFVVPREPGITAEAARRMFDGSNLDMELDFIVHDSPFVTPSGKVPLLVRAGARRLKER